MYSRAHVLIASLAYFAGQALLLVVVAGKDDHLSVIFTAQLLVVVFFLVLGFKETGKRPDKWAPMASLTSITKRLWPLAVVGVVLSLLAPLLLPSGYLSQHDGTTSAISSVLMTSLLLPVSGIAMVSITMLAAISTTRWFQPPTD